MNKILIMGATSAIAEATARSFAAHGASLYLVARNAQKLADIAADLKIRGAKNVFTRILDARDLHQHRQLIEDAAMQLSGLDAALVAHGTLSDQKACEQSINRMVDEFTTNALSVMSLCSELANFFSAQKHGTIAAISSVAGDRGRKSNYVYASSKAAIDCFLSGMGQRLSRSGVKVVVVKPGFVISPMTAAFKKSAIWATPAAVAKVVTKAMIRGTPVVYVPWFWRPIMLIIRGIPERIFRRLSF